MKNKQEIITPQDPVQKKTIDPDFISETEARCHALTKRQEDFKNSMSVVGEAC